MKLALLPDPHLSVHPFDRGDAGIVDQNGDLAPNLGNRVANALGGISGRRVRTSRRAASARRPAASRASLARIQGGGLNYAVWFLSAGPAGNPWWPARYFSVVLNRPYQGDAPRRAAIDLVFDLYRAFRDEPWVEADQTFLKVLAEGPPGRRT